MSILATTDQSRASGRGVFLCGPVCPRIPNTSATARFRMKFEMAIVLVAALLAEFSSADVSAQPTPMFSASARSQGAPFDLTVTESERFPTKSYLDVPGFHTRTAPGSRWLMCAYTALAMQRGFSNWFVVYPAPTESRVVIALSNDPKASPAELLGTDYNKEQALGERMMPVDTFAAFCGMQR